MPYTVPSRSDPPAESIRQIWFASGSDLPPDQFYYVADSILCRENNPSLVQVFRQEKSLVVRMMYVFSLLLEHFYIILNFCDSWNQLPDDLQLHSLWEVSNSNGACVNHKQAKRNEAKFVIKNGILH